MNTHLSNQFDAELDDVRAQLTQMGGLVEQQIKAALASLTLRDEALLERIIAGDKAIDALEVAIDDACTHIIAKRQPAAGDLRLLISIIKAMHDLERMGDEAKKIAKVLRKIDENHRSVPLVHEVDLRNMGELVLPVVRSVLDAFVRRDALTAADIVRSDREIDNVFRSVMRLLVTYMMEDPRTITMAIDLIFIAKSIERIGDHAKNIAEHVIFIAEGLDVRHKGLSALDQLSGPA